VAHRRRRAIIALVGFAALVVANPARAEDREMGMPQVDPGPVSPEARRLFEQGKRHLQSREYDAALRNFQESYALYPVPGLLYIMAQAHRLKGDCAMALSFYRRYLPVAPSDKNLREKTEARIADMERCTAEQKAKPAAPPGLPAPAPPSASTAPAPAPTPPPPPPTSIGKQEGAPAPVALPPAAPAAADTGRPLRATAWVTGAGSVALLGFGAYELTVGGSKIDKYNQTPTATDKTRSCGVNLPNHGGGDCPTLYDEWKSARRLGIIGLVAGGALAVTSATFFVLSARRDPEAQPAPPRWLACAPNLTGVGLSCGGWF
jgi:hypothetical protein